MGWLTNVWNAITGKKTTVKPSKVNLVGFLDSLSGSSDVTLSSTYMSCVNCHARHFSKILPTHYFGKDISKSKHNNYLLQLQPNDYQTAPTLWKSVAFNYFFGSVAILWLEFDYSNLAEPLKSIWSLDVDANQIRVFISEEGKQYCSFSINGQVHYVAAEDLIILQREVDLSSLFGGRSKAIDASIKALNTSYKGLEKAVEQSQLIRFLITGNAPANAAVKEERQKEYSEQLFKNQDGVAYVTGGDKIQEVTSNGKYPLSPELESLKKDIYEYQAVTSEIVQGKYNEDEFQAYWESTLEPLANELAVALTIKLFSRREISQGNVIHIQSDRVQTASLKTRLNMANLLRQLPIVVENDILALLYLKPVEGGDEPQVNLSFIKQKDQSQYQVGGEDNPGEGEGE